MRSFVVETLLPYDTATPHELNAELADLVGTVHALDRDNLAGSLPASAAAPGTWNVEEFDTRSTVRTTTHAAYGSVGEVWPVPDEAGDAWALDVQTGDGVLEIIGSVGVQETTGASMLIHLGVKVDGALVGEGPMPFATRSDGLEVEAVVPVGSGVHRVELVYLTHFSGIGSGRTFDWEGGSIYVRGMNR